MANVNMVVHGLKETQAKLTQNLKDLNGSPMTEAMRDATLLIQRGARKGVPVDRGTTRASILPELRQSGGIFDRTVIGVVGSNQKSALFMEVGTRPHWPPLAALETWARRHGTTAYVVARAIARRGIKARRYFQNAVDENRDKIFRKFEQAVKRAIR